MRLGTLARKISITPSKLTAYLESQSADLSSGTNTKLSDEEIEMVLTHFNASLAAEPTQEDESAPAEPETKEAQKEPSEVEMEDLEPAISEADSEQESLIVENEEIDEKSKSSTISDSFAEIALPHELEDVPEVKTSVSMEGIPPEPEQDAVDEESTKPEPKTPVEIDPEIESAAERAAYDDSIEVIKPPKVKLPGLKVKGKIDLPEPKAPSSETEDSKKEEKIKSNPDEIITTTGPKRERRRKPKNYKGKKYDKDYNPIEAARRKKEWEEKKRKEKEEKRKKKAKERHYKKTVAPVAKSTYQKKKTKKTGTSQKQTQEQASGNLLQRFWRWMNT